MSKVSVCTIYAQRQTHLQNLVKSLISSQMYPDELVIVCMGDHLPELPQTPFKINSVNIPVQNKQLPLAKARNQAAEIAQGDRLIFLDVDCICSPSLVNIFNYHLTKEDALYQGSVRYLSANWQQQDWTFPSLFEQSSANQLQGIELTKKQKVNHPYELFWSLCFGISKKTFFDIGGFDCKYSGYGGEDTDFAFTVRTCNIPFYKVSALAYHQYHPSYSPPLNHLSDIVRNAQIFERKWHILPMQKWLDKFVQLGFIEIQNKTIKIIKQPTNSEIQACIKSN